jgi:hypothetical protein
MTSAMMVTVTAAIVPSLQVTLVTLLFLFLILGFIAGCIETMKALLSQIWYSAIFHAGSRSPNLRETPFIYVTLISYTEFDF